MSKSATKTLDIKVWVISKWYQRVLHFFYDRKKWSYPFARMYMFPNMLNKPVVPAASFAITSLSRSPSLMGEILARAFREMKIFIGADWLLEFTNIWPLAMVFFRSSLWACESLVLLKLVFNSVTLMSPSGDLWSIQRTIEPVDIPWIMALVLIEISRLYRGACAALVPSASTSSSWAYWHTNSGTVSGLSKMAAETSGMVTLSMLIAFLRVIPVTALTIGRAILTLRPKLGRRYLKRRIVLSTHR